MPALPYFTLINLVLVLIVFLRPDLHEKTGVTWLMPVGLCFMALSGVISLTMRDRYRLTYDLFLVGALVFWWVYWREVYQPGAPLFKFYPIYFTILSLLLTACVINPRQRFDDDQLQLMRLLDGLFLFRPELLVGLTLVSLYLPEQYVFYPVIVSFVYIRYAIVECLGNACHRK